MATNKRDGVSFTFTQFGKINFRDKPQESQGSQGLQGLQGSRGSQGSEGPQALQGSQGSQSEVTHTVPVSVFVFLTVKLLC